MPPLATTSGTPHARQPAANAATGLPPCLEVPLFQQYEREHGNRQHRGLHANARCDRGATGRPGSSARRSAAQQQCLRTDRERKARQSLIGRRPDIQNSGDAASRSVAHIAARRASCASIPNFQLPTPKLSGIGRLGLGIWDLGFARPVRPTPRIETMRR